MNFYHFLKKESNALEMSLLVYYSLAGFLNFLIIAVIIYSLGAVDSQSHAISIVILLVSIVGFVIVQKYSLDQTCRIVEQIITKIRIRLTDHIRRIDLRSYESIHHEDFLMLLTRDTTDISGAAQNISRIVSSIALVLVACLYITLLSPLALLISGIVIFYGIRIYQKQIAEYEEEKDIAAEKENRFFALMRHLLSGFKEIKLNENKNNDLYHNDMVPVSAQAKWHNISATHCLNHSVVFSQVFSYLLLGFLIFLYPKLVQIDQSTLIQVVGLILFVTTGPVREIVGSLPLVERANAAIANIREMESQLGRLDIHPIPSAEDIRTTKPFLSLEFNNVTFAYNHSQKGKAFRIGPIDLTIHRGEVVFFMGGNGTGKTTLLKVLTGLYFPEEGVIKLNDKTITRENNQYYRSYFSVIFQQMHLFDRLYGLSSLDREWSESMLETLQLENKTGITPDGRFTSLQLSMGQKKRLALLVSELEKRDIHVYDEWAADQDPMFRKYFYEVYLNDLIKQGKTVIAITHDDSYYHIADRIYKMDDGQLISVK